MSLREVGNCLRGKRIVNDCTEMTALKNPQSRSHPASRFPSTDGLREILMLPEVLTSPLIYQSLPLLRKDGQIAFTVKYFINDPARQR